MLFDKLRIPWLKKPMKLYHRIVLFFILAFTLIISISFLMVFFFSQQVILNENQSTMIRFNDYVINTIDENASTILSLPTNERLNFISEKIFPYVKNNSLIVYRLSDNHKNRYQSSQILNDLLSPALLSKYDIDFSNFSFDETAEEGLSSTNISVKDFRYNQTEYYYLGSSYILGENDFITIEIVKNLNDSYVFMTTLFIIIIGISALGLIAIIIVGIYGTKGSLKPLIQISEIAKNISENNLNLRLEETGNKDELDQLIISLNQMMEKLESAFTIQKQFVSDASHELRIPLTVIQGYIDILGDWGKNDPHLIEESIEAVRDEIQGMKKMINELLLISRIENNCFSEAFKILDLSLILEKIFPECLMIDEDHHYLLDSCEKVFVRGNEALLIQAFRGLINNAQKYTSKGGTITLSCKIENETVASISVKDTGIGISKTEIHKIKERFYRVQSHRSRKTGGTGLGLSIIDSIVKNHRGQLIIESEENSGTQVFVKLKRIS